MPTYDYLCPNGNRFEVVHSVTATGPETCPVCGAAPVRKAVTAPTIHFKGSGWAKKDRSVAPSSSSTSKTETPSGETASASSTKERDKDTGAKGDPSTSSSSSAASDSAAPASPSSAAD